MKNLEKKNGTELNFHRHRLCALGCTDYVHGLYWVVLAMCTGLHWICALDCTDDVNWVAQAMYLHWVAKAMRTGIGRVCALGSTGKCAGKCDNKAQR